MGGMTEKIPASLLPADGRFGSGPSKVRDAQLAAITAFGSPMGTSHRQAAVRGVVAEIQEGLAELFGAPEGYEVLLGNGGASLLWDAIAFCVAERRTQTAVFGEFSGKAAKAVAKVPWIGDAEVVEAPVGSVAACIERDGVDTYLYPHNETSTGAVSQVRRVGPAPATGADALTLVDATSIAGGATVDLAETDMYYFSPQKCFGADGGLWISLASPAALERIERLGAERWVPDILNLQLAAKNSRKNQTLNTPALATLLMVAGQVRWMLAEGGLEAMEARTAASSLAVYSWAEARDFAAPFVERAEDRSPVVATIDFDDAVDASEISRFLRENGIVDIDPYRSLGRNQLRIGMFPAVELADVEALLACIDWAVARGVGRRRVLAPARPQDSGTGQLSSV